MKKQLKIVVLAKQVPDTRNVGKDAMTPEGTVNRAALPAIFNPEDLNALEMALALKDRTDASTVHILTMGPQRAADIIRDAMFRGADGGYLLSGREFAGSDTLATSYALSCALKNGDAHLKNFGVLYDDAESEVRLAPIYDLVTTTAYKPADILALTLGGSKRWPAAKALLAFARTHCNMTEARARELLGAVAQGVLRAAQELRQHLHGTPAFQTVGAAMLAEWSVGLKHSNQP